MERLKHSFVRIRFPDFSYLLLCKINLCFSYPFLIVMCSAGFPITCHYCSHIKVFLSGLIQGGMIVLVCPNSVSKNLRFQVPVYLYSVDVG